MTAQEAQQRLCNLVWCVFMQDVSRTRNDSELEASLAQCRDERRIEARAAAAREAVSIC